MVHSLNSNATSSVSARSPASRPPVLAVAKGDTMNNFTGAILSAVVALVPAAAYADGHSGLLRFTLFRSGLAVDRAPPQRGPQILFGREAGI
jgi:hypothetical protein